MLVFAFLSTPKKGSTGQSSEQLVHSSLPASKYLREFQCEERGFTPSLLSRIPRAAPQGWYHMTPNQDHCRVVLKYSGTCLLSESLLRQLPGFHRLEQNHWLSHPQTQNHLDHLGTTVVGLFPEALKPSHSRPSLAFYLFISSYVSFFLSTLASPFLFLPPLLSSSLLSVLLPPLLFPRFSLFSLLPFPFFTTLSPHPPLPLSSPSLPSLSVSFMSSQVWNFQSHRRSTMISDHRDRQIDRQ